MRYSVFSAAFLLIFLGAHTAFGDVRITEWMYQGSSASGGEFIEFTNVGTKPIDMTGWSFDDDHRVPGAFDLSAFGVVMPGESVILAEDPAESFRADWNLPAEIKIIGNLGNPNGNNLGRNDEINLYDEKGALVDRLTYGDQAFPGTIRTRWFTGNPVTFDALGANDPHLWILASVGDELGSWMSSSGDVGNPGLFKVSGGVPDVPVRLNELMASNSSSITDEDGDHSDWIELHNFGDEPINLLGYGLSDNAGNPFKWVMPDVSIAPGEYRIVFASGKDRYGAELHTNFAVSADGEVILLTHPTGVMIDQIPPTPIPTDISFGRQPDATGPWVFFNEPTPGASNTTPGYQISGPVIASHGGGRYTQGFDLVLTSDPDATIYYTLDGSLPTQDSLVYTGPISITDRGGDPNVFSEIQTAMDSLWLPPAGEVFKATVVRARAIRPGAEFGPPLSQTLFVDEQIHTRYTLPLISITTDSDNLFGYEQGIYVPGLIYDQQSNPDLPWYAHPANYTQSGIAWERQAHMEFYETDGSLAFAHDVGLRIHGGGTTAFPRKSLRIYARGEYGQSWIDYPVFGKGGLSQFKRLILRNSGNEWDQTVFRDALLQTIVKDTGIDTQNYRPAIVFINGEYWGIHNIRERYDDWYVSTTHHVPQEEIDLLEYGGQVVHGENSHYLALLPFVQNNDMALPENLAHVETQMDVDNFITYYASQIYFRNHDWPFNNIKFWRHRTPEGRWRWLLYDTDYGFGFQGGYWSYVQNTLNWLVNELQSNSTVLFKRLLENEQFRIRFINRQADLLNTAFLPSRVHALIDDRIEELEPHMPEHIHRWQKPISMESWHNGPASIFALRVYATHRGTQVRLHYAQVFNLSGQATLTLDNPTPDRGSIGISTLDLDELGVPWSGIYFIGVPVPLHATPAEGYHFAGWEGVVGSEGATVFHYAPTGDATLTATFVKTPDLNGDGIVDVLDLITMLAAWGPCPKRGHCTADLNENGTVDVQDLLILLASWG